MIPVTSPVNSFVKFGSPDAVDSCLENENVCLPIWRLTDLQFQFFVPSDGRPLPDPAQYYLTLTGTNTLVGNLEFIEGLLTHVGFINTWEDDGVLEGIVDKRKCFNLTLNGPNKYRTTWTFAGITFPRAGSDTYEIIDSGELPVTFMGGVSSLADLAAKFNLTYPGYGAWSAAGNKLFLDSDTFVPTNGWGDIHIDDGTEEGVDAEVESRGYSGDVELGVSNCFYRVTETCFSTIVKYRCNENAFGFQYNNKTITDPNTLDDFYNQVRLPFHLNNPHPVTKRAVYRKSTGKYKKLSAIMQAEWEGHFDWVDWEVHKKFAIALEHDDLFFFDSPNSAWVEYMADETDNYEPDWSHNKPGVNVNVAPAEFKIKLSPFANFNNNCQ